MPYPLEQKHKYFFDWFENKRKTDGLYYSVRQKGGDRLKHGYIFLGNDCYVAVPLVAHRDWQNKTASIQFGYFTPDGHTPYYYLEIVSRNLAGKDLNDEETDQDEKKFHEAIIEFGEEIVKYVKENAGRILTEDECVRFYRTRRDLTPKDIKESIFLTPASAQRMENNEYSAKLYFNESSENAALEKFYDFWKEYGIPYWQGYFADSKSTKETINKSLAKIDHSLAECDWPKKID